MTVEDLGNSSDFSALVMPDPKKELSGVYIGDLLSWVMGRASGGDAWVTIMSNMNVLAVATLADVSCVILAEGVSLDKEVADAAKEKGINILLSDKPEYETAIELSRLLK